MKRESKTVTAVYASTSSIKNDRHSLNENRDADLTVRLAVVCIEDDKIRNGIGETTNDLHISGYVERLRDGTLRPWGMRVAYQTGEVELRRAQEMVTVLKRVEARMAKSDIRPTTFGQYAALAAKAIGCTKVVIQRGPSRGWSYDDNSHSTQALASAQVEIDHLISEALAEIPRRPYTAYELEQQQKAAEEIRAEQQQAAEAQAEYERGHGITQ